MIQPTSNFTGYSRADAISNLANQKSTPVDPQAGKSDHLSSSSSDGLRQALAQTSEIRPEVVARGKALAIDPNHPPRQLIESLSKLMLESRDPSENS